MTGARNILPGGRAPLARAGGPLVAIGTQTPHRPDSGLLVARRCDLQPMEAALASELGGRTLYTSASTERILAQTLQCLANLSAALETVGTDRSRVVLLRVFLREAHDRPVVARAIRAWFGEALPAGEIVIARNAGSSPSLLVHLDALAAPAGAAWPLRRGTVAGLVALSEPFPSYLAFGPYVFTSALPGAMDGTGRLPGAAADLAAPERAVLAELGDIPAGVLPFVLQQAAMWALGRQVLAEAGTMLDRVFHHLAWLGVSMRELANGSITRLVSPLVRGYGLTCFPVFGFHRPGSLIEGRFAALLSGQGLEKVERVPLHGISQSYVGAIEVGGLVFGAGEVPIDTAARRLVTRPGDDPIRPGAAFGLLAAQAEAAVQAAYVYGLIGETLAAHSLGPADVLQQTLYLADVADQCVVEGAAQAFFGAKGLPPTAVAPILGASPFPETRLEIEFIAAKQT